MTPQDKSKMISKKEAQEAIMAGQANSISQDKPKRTNEEITTKAVWNMGYGDFEPDLVKAYKNINEALEAKDSEITHEKTVNSSLMQKLSDLSHDFPVGWHETYKRMKEKLSENEVLSEQVIKLQRWLDDRKSEVASLEKELETLKSENECYRETLEKIRDREQKWHDRLDPKLTNGCKTTDVGTIAEEALTKFNTLLGEK